VAEGNLEAPHHFEGELRDLKDVVLVVDAQKMSQRGGH
jgi:hypothetical protein